MLFFLSFLILVGCSSTSTSIEKTTKEKVEFNRKLLEEVRPFLKSDELAYMKCENKGKISVEKQAHYNSELWKSLGDLELRKLAIEKNANIMSLSYGSFGDIERFFADLYLCKDVNTSKFVEIAGMCKPSEERMFKIKYDAKELRETGEDLIKAQIEYHAISNHYKTYHYHDIKYSYSKKEFSGKGIFFKCY